MRLDGEGYRLGRQRCHVSIVVVAKDENGSNSYRIEFGCHILPHFKSNTDTESDILGYEYKTDVSDSDSNLYIDLIYELTCSYFLY